MNYIFEAKQQFNNILSQILSELRNDNDEYLKEIFNNFPDFFKHCMSERNLLVEAYRLRAIKCFAFMAETVECENKKQQFNYVEKLALKTHRFIARPLKSDEVKSLDMLATFSTSKVFSEKLSVKLNDVSTRCEHKTLYKAYLLANNINPYQQIQNVKTRL